jgi:hypothetical protein
LKEWKWPCYNIPDDIAVAEKKTSHFKIAVGGNVKTDWTTAGVGGESSASGSLSISI